VAGKKTLKGHPAAFKGAVFAYGLQAVAAAAGCKSTLHAQQGRYSALVKANDSYEQYGK